MKEGRGTSYVGLPLTERDSILTGWRQVEVDVPYVESKAARSTIEALMWPSKTVMDLVCVHSIPSTVRFRSLSSIPR